MTTPKPYKTPAQVMIELIGAGGRKCVPVEELPHWLARGFETAPGINKPVRRKAVAPPLPPAEE